MEYILRLNIFFASFFFVPTSSKSLPLYSSRTSLTERTVEGKVNMLLAVHSDQKGRNVNNSSSHADVSLADENTGVVHGFSQTHLEDHSLKTAVEKLIDSQSENEIEFLLFLRQNSKASESAKESVSFKDTSGVCFIKGEQGTSSLSDLGQNELNAPDLAFVLEAEFSDSFQFRVDSLLLVRTTRGSRSLACIAVVLGHLQAKSNAV